MCYDDVVVANGATLTIEGNTIQEMTTLTLGTANSGPVSVTGKIVANGDPASGKGVEFRANNIFVYTNSSIRADGTGYAAQQGPGGSTTGGGAHAGGGASGLNARYGSIHAPITLGSGGKTTAGGGAMKFVISGDITQNGTISASGVDPACTSGQGTGAGGSIWFEFTTSGVWAGSGHIEARPGQAYTHCAPGVQGGSGGRISVTGYGTKTFSGSLSVDPLGSSTFGSAGTRVERSSSQAVGTLQVGNRDGYSQPVEILNTDPVFNNYVIKAPVKVGIEGDFVLPSGTTFTADDSSFVTIGANNDIVVASGATFTLIGHRYSAPANPNYFYYYAQLDIGDTNAFIAQNGSTVSLGYLSIINNIGTGTFDISALPSLSLVGTLNTNHTATNAFSPTFTILDTGNITHPANSSTKVNWLDLTFNNLTIDDGGIDVLGKGYGPGQGPGGSVTGGGSYAAAGANGSEVVYGSLTAPVDLGSGGSAGSGGGAVKLSIAGDFVNNGQINASAHKFDACNPAAGTGSGGSVWVDFTGNGMWSGDGSIYASPTYAGGSSCITGSGGRIAVTGYASDSHTGSSNAGSNGTPGLIGAGGTVVHRSSTQAVGKLILQYSYSDLPIKVFNSDPVFDEYLVDTARSEFGVDGDFILPSGSAFRIAPWGLVTIVENNDLIVQSGASFNVTGRRRCGWVECWEDFAELSIGSGSSFVAQSGATLTLGNYSNINNVSTGTFNLSGQTSVDLAGTLNTNHTATNLFPSNTTIAYGGKITHPANLDSQEYWLDLEFDNLAISNYGSIDGAAKGFAGGAVSTAGSGAGGGAGTASGGAGGGGHALAGISGTGGSGGVAYGTASNPSTLGSGGGGGLAVGGSGGGYVKLTVAGNLSIASSGAVQANGGAGGATTGGGGAGGSVDISAGSVSCETFWGLTTRVTASGGAGGGPTAGAGSAGFIEFAAGNTVDCQIQISTTSLPDAQVSVGYLENIEVIHANPPVSYSVVTGSLPPGLYIGYGGLIQGTPTTPGTYNFTVRAQDLYSYDTQALQIVVGNAPIPPVNITTTYLPGQTAGLTYDQYVYTQHGVGGVTISMLTGSLPPGLSLSQVDDNGRITGTPTTPGSYSFTLQAEDSRGIDTQAYTLVIYGPSSLQITTEVLPDVNAYGSYYGYYSEYIYTANSSGSVTYSVISGSLPPGLSLSSGGWYGMLQGSATTAGTYTFTVQAQDSRGTGVVGDTDAQEYTIVVPDVPDINITTTTLPNGRVGRSYNRTIYYENYRAYPVFTVASGSLPPGVSLTLEGYLEGTPTQAGTYSFSVQADDGFSSDIQALTLVVDPLPPEIENTPIVTITSPSNNSTFPDGASAIAGTGPANKPISIFIDGVQVGATTATDQGTWTYQASGVSAGTHTLEAKWVPGSDVVFVPYTDQDYRSAIQVIDLASTSVVKTIGLPSGYLVTGVSLNASSTMLYAYGMNLTTGITSLWEVDFNTVTLRSLELDPGIPARLAISGDNKVGVISLITPEDSGVRLQTIDLESFSVGGEPSSLPSPFRNVVISKSVINSLGTKLFTGLGAEAGTLLEFTLVGGALRAIDLPGDDFVDNIAYNDGKLFIVTRGTELILHVLDEQTGVLIKSVVLLSEGVDSEDIASIDIDLAANRAYIATGPRAGQIISVNLQTDGVDITAPAPIAAYDIGLSSSDSRLFIPNYYGGMVIWNTQTSTFEPNTASLTPVGTISYAFGSTFLGPITPPKDSIAFTVAATPVDCTATGTCPVDCKVSGTCPTVDCAVTNSCPVTPPPVVVQPPTPTTVGSSSTTYPKIVTTPFPPATPTVSRLGWFDRGVLAVARFVPRQAAIGFPFLLFLLLLLFALSLYYQSTNEVRKDKLNRQFLAKRKSIRAQQDNFIALASHYLNTPITIIQNGIEVMEDEARHKKG